MWNLNRIACLGILTASLLGTPFATACETKKPATKATCPSSQQKPATVAPKLAVKAEPALSPIARAAQKTPAKQSPKVAINNNQPPRDSKDPGPIAPE